jgi:hypothetical protein
MYMYKAVDREDERQRTMETGCWGDQGSPRGVAPRGRKEGTYKCKSCLQIKTVQCDCVWCKLQKYLHKNNYFICALDDKI